MPTAVLHFEQCDVSSIGILPTELEALNFEEFGKVYRVTSVHCLGRPDLR